MSLKWKWLLTAFLTQLFVGGVFITIHYHHLGEVADERLMKLFQQIEQDVKNRVLIRGAIPVDKFLQNIGRQIYLQYAPSAIAINDGKREIVSMGGERNLNQLKNTNPEALMSVKGLFVKTFQFDIQGFQFWTVMDKAEVYHERDRSVLFVAQVLLLSAVASSLMLLGLSHTLTSRLFRLRDKAMALQTGQPGVRMEVSGRDEITVLGRAFNEMADSIESHINTLNDSNEQIISERNRMDSLLSSISTGIAYLDNKFDLVYVNKAFGQMLNTSWPSPSDNDMSALLVNAGLVKEQRIILNELIREHIHRRQLPVDLDFENHKTLRFRFQIQNDEVLGVHGIVLVEDVSLHKNVQDLRQEVERDPLTSTLNRRGFDLALDNRVSRLMPGESLGLLFLDLDGFKMVNDSLGHKAGDQVLRCAAQLLNSACRTVDVVARLGGDEFAVIVARASTNLLENMAERIVKAFEREPLFKRMLENHSLKVSSSIGCAIYPIHAETAAALVEESDRQMYEAKHAGKNCYRIAQSPKAKPCVLESPTGVVVDPSVS
jgi:diguanylate cyclase (GGDEF)-like protein